MTSQHLFHPDLKIVKELVYDKCGFVFENLKPNSESIEYGACSFELQGKIIEHRVSKITPTKAGQFVTIWKRGTNGTTQAFDISDNIEFIVVTSKNTHNFGQFFFPKGILINKGIISQKGVKGKRGIRVYPPWDNVNSRQAEITQAWQTKYFLTINNGDSVDLGLARKLLGK